MDVLRGWYQKTREEDLEKCPKELAWTSHLTHAAINATIAIVVVFAMSMIVPRIMPKGRNQSPNY